MLSIRVPDGSMANPWTGWKKSATSNITAECSSFTPPACNAPAPHQKAIVVKGWSDEELKSILTDFGDAYEEALGDKFEFEICSFEHGATRTTFPHDIHFNEFCYLVNYLNYPKDYDLKTHSISVAGKVTLSSNFQPAHTGFIGKKAVFYVPEDDQLYDLVYVHVENETFQIRFTNMHWEKVDEPRVPAGIDISHA